MKRLSVTLSVLAMILSSLLLAYPASASNSQVCPVYEPGSGKIDTSGDPQSVPFTAPEGYLIDGYCVKAGSANQGDGPEYIAVDPPAKSVTITHTSGKAVSHYSVSYVPITPVEPPTPILVTPDLKAVAPAAVCGESGTAVPVPTEGVEYSEVWYEGDIAKVVATALEGFTFKDGATQVTLEVAIQIATECPPELTDVTPPDMVVTPSAVCETRGTAAPVAIEGVEYGEVWYEGDIAKVTATTVDGFIFPDDSHSMVLEANVASTVKCDDVDEPVDPIPTDPTPTPAPVDPTPTPVPGGDGDDDGDSDGDGGTVDNGGDTDTDVDPTPAPVTPVPVTPAPTAAPAVNPVTGLPITGSGPGEDGSTWPLFAVGALVLLGGGVLGARRRVA